ncbi:hypothetical protein MSSAC_3528 [Methanosarcina siciliae C2J]|uniref:Uncharacterized protein n=1 Tax=Methanosarcina siciliae C2J TaxID=1434118 RepID=A0A0E3PS00_9EURY|nr:hypothetical protein MSSAC_3528 [Methanosarcina siciliae C2J]
MIYDLHAVPVLVRFRCSHSHIAVICCNNKAPIISNVDTISTKNLNPYVIRVSAGRNGEKLLHIIPVGFCNHCNAGIQFPERDNLVGRKPSLPFAGVVPQEIRDFCLCRVFSLRGQRDYSTVSGDKLLFQCDPTGHVILCNCNRMGQVSIGYISRSVECVGIKLHSFRLLTLVLNERDMYVHQLGGRSLRIGMGFC